MSSRSKNQHESNEKAVTLRDIAKRCGVGVATVSRAFNAPSSQSEATSARILAAAKEMGYDPARFHAARQMSLIQYGKSSVNHLTALFLPQKFYNSTFFNLILQGTLETLTTGGFGLITIEQTDSATMNLPKSFNQGDIDGAIIYSTGSFRRIATVLRDLPMFGNRPIILVSDSSENKTNVMMDRTSGSYQAIKHLLNLGHRHIMYIQGPDKDINIIRPNGGMYAGYLQAFRESGLDPDIYLHPAELGNQLWTTAFEPSLHPKLYSLEYIDVWKNNPLLRSLRQHPEVTAIMTPNDPCALVTYHLLRHAGLDVPQDISLIGFDDTMPLCDKHWRNILTTVKLPLKQVGSTAAEILIKQITADKPIEPIRKVLPTSLVVRGTTAPPREQTL